MKELKVKSKTFNQKDTLVLEHEIVSNEELKTELRKKLDFEFITITADFNTDLHSVTITTQVWEKLVNRRTGIAFSYQDSPSSFKVYYLLPNYSSASSILYFSCLHNGYEYSASLLTSGSTHYLRYSKNKLNKLYKSTIWVGDTFTGGVPQFKIISTTDIRTLMHGAQIGSTTALDSSLIDVLISLGLDNHLIRDYEPTGNYNIYYKSNNKLYGLPFRFNNATGTFTKGTAFECPNFIIISTEEI